MTAKDALLQLNASIALCDRCIASTERHVDRVLDALHKDVRIPRANLIARRDAILSRLDAASPMAHSPSPLAPPAPTAEDIAMDDINNGFDANGRA